MVAEAGRTIRYEGGPVMADSHDKLPRRTFAAVMFVGHVAAVGQ